MRRVGGGGLAKYVIFFYFLFIFFPLDLTTNKKPELEVTTAVNSTSTLRSCLGFFRFLSFPFPFPPVLFLPIFLFFFISF